MHYRVSWDGTGNTNRQIVVQDTLRIGIPSTARLAQTNGNWQESVHCFLQIRRPTRPIAGLSPTVDNGLGTSCSVVGGPSM
jgi:hypothetical protein